jgi:hypothetical protein
MTMSARTKFTGWQPERWPDLLALIAALYLDRWWSAEAVAAWWMIVVALTIRLVVFTRDVPQSALDQARRLGVDLLAAAAMLLVFWQWLPGAGELGRFVPLWLALRQIGEDAHARRGEAWGLWAFLAVAGYLLFFGRAETKNVFATLAGGVVLVSLLVRFDTAGPARWRQLPPWLRQAPLLAVTALAAVLIARRWGDFTGWQQALLAGWSAGAVGAWRWVVLSSGRKGAGAQLGAILLLAGLAYVIKPYVRPEVVGSGESFHYALQIADFVDQMRAGQLPVLVGDSVYAFNGNVHTVRTAPWFTLAAGILDGLSGRQLSPVGLLNMLAVLALFAAGGIIYRELGRILPQNPVLRSALALLYLSSPAALAPLFGSDMFTTHLVLPWLPLVVGGVVRVVRDGEWPRGVMQGAVALAAVWWTHPPIAIWLSAFWVVALLVPLAVRRSERFGWRWAVVGVGAMVVLTSYVFYSVISLQLSDPSTALQLRVNIVHHVRLAWPGIWRPLSPHGAELADLQLGYGLLTAAFVGLGGITLVGKRPLWLVGLLVAAVALQLMLVPGTAELLWRVVPRAVMVLTNNWPMQRFYPLIGLLVIFAAAGGAAGLVQRWRQARWWLGAGLAVAIGWNFTEVRKLHARADSAAAANIERTTTRFRPENIELMRSSYLLFGRYPPYYSHGVMDPHFENRRLDPDFTVNLSNASHAQELADDGRSIGSWSLAQPVSFTLNARERSTRALPPADHYGLIFEFAEGADALFIRGDQGLDRVTLLGHTGERLAFGPGPGGSRFLPVTLPHHDPETVTIRSMPASGIRVSVIPLSSAELPIHLRSLRPYSVELEGRAGEWLETPKMFIPGYAATVNGRPAKLTKAPSGLVAVEMVEGANEIVLAYPGPPGLRLLFWLSPLLFGLVLVAFVRLPRLPPRAESR